MLLALVQLSPAVTMPFAILGHAGVLGKRLAVLWIGIAAIWPLTVYLATEIAFARRMAKQSDAKTLTCPPRDTNYERAIYRKGIFYGTSLYVGASVFVLAGLIWLG